MAWRYYIAPAGNVTVTDPDSADDVVIIAEILNSGGNGGGPRRG